MSCSVEESETPLFVFYNYHSVPLPAANIEQLVTFVTSNLPCDLSRFVFCCDVRRTPQDVMDTVESIARCEIEHFSLKSLELFLSERVRRYASLVGDAVGVIALVTGSGDFGTMMKALKSSGWHLELFYPPDTVEELISFASHAIELPVRTVEEQEPPVAEKQEGFNKNVSRLIEVMNKVGAVVKKEETNSWGIGPNGDRSEEVGSLQRRSTEDCQSLVGSAASQTQTGGVWNPSHSTVPPMALPPQMKRNPFGGEQHGNSNPFNRNPFEEPQDKPNPFNRNPFESSPWTPTDAPPAPRFQKNPFGPPKPRTEIPQRPPGPQCPLWDDRSHSKTADCYLYHPRKPCRFFPRCRMTAEACNYAHPFCHHECCICGENKDPQVNHIQ